MAHCSQSEIPSPSTGALVYMSVSRDFNNYTITNTKSPLERNVLDFLGFLRYVLSFHIITLYHFLRILPHLPVAVSSHLVVVAMSFLPRELLLSFSTHLHTCTFNNQLSSSLSSKPSSLFILIDCHCLKIFSVISTVSYSVYKQRGAGVFYFQDASFATSRLNSGRRDQVVKPLFSCVSILDCSIAPELRLAK